MDDRLSGGRGALSVKLGGMQVNSGLGFLLMEAEDRHGEAALRHTVAIHYDAITLICALDHRIEPG